MASTTLVSVEEYLKTSYEPNCEYIDGVLRPKPLGTSKHGYLQGLLWALLCQRGYRVAVELTVCISPTQFLIPDVAADSKPFGDPYPDTPALLCIEILSPGDRVLTMLAKCEDYHAWGVPYCWAIDPENARAWEYHREGALESRTDSLRAGDIGIEISQLY